MSLQQAFFAVAHTVQPIQIASGIFGKDSAMKWIALAILCPVAAAEHFPETFPFLFDIAPPFGLLYVTSAGVFFYKQYHKAKIDRKSLILVTTGLYFATLFSLVGFDKGQTEPILEDHIKTYKTTTFVLWHGLLHCVNLSCFYVAGKIVGSGNDSHREKSV